MKSEKFFTIAIPAYERPEYTREALESCLAQDDDNFEILVGDDSESDVIEDLVKSFNHPDIIYFRNRPARGLCGNLNILLQKTRTPWMLVLANDDRLEKGCLSAIHKVISEHQDAALVRMRYKIIGDKGQELRIDRANPFQMSSLEFLSQLFSSADDVPWMSITGVAYPTANLKKVGGYKEYHRGHHIDREAWAQLAVFGSCYFIQEVQAGIRSHREEITTLMDPNYEKAVQATQLMQESMEALLDQRQLEVKNSEERALLDVTRQRLQGYVDRQLARCFDQGIMARLEQKRLNSFWDMKVIRKKMERSKASLFSSFYLYSFLLLLPARLRLQIIPLVKEYKFRRWHH